MKATYYLLMISTSFFVACNSTSEKAATSNAVKPVEAERADSLKPLDEPIPVSITKAEAKKRLEQYLKVNKRKFEENGEIQEIEIGFGDYDGDQKDDFFFTAMYFGGGDYLYPEYFYYDSKTDAIRNVSLKSKFDTDIHNVKVRSIDKSGLSGVSDVWAAFSGEHSYWRTVKTKFQLVGNSITIEKAYDRALAKATQEVNAEMEAAQNELYGESTEDENTEEVDY
jgi:hypothetical protein